MFPRTDVAHEPHMITRSAFPPRSDPVFRLLTPIISHGKSGGILGGHEGHHAQKSLRLQSPGSLLSPGPGPTTLLGAHYERG